jgi:hypothetical protein
VGAGALNWNVAPPYQYGGGNSIDMTNTIGWRMVSCEILLVNTTPLVARGGTVTSCQPPREYSATTQGDFTQFDSFGLVDGSLLHQEECASLKDGECDCEAHLAYSISWIPRQSDISYYVGLNGSPDAGAEPTGLWIWLNAPASEAQNFAFYMACNWELTGTHLRSISSPAVHHPLASDVMPTTLEMLHNSGGDATHALETATLTAASKDSGFNGFLHEAMGFGSAILKSAPYAIGALTGGLPATLAGTIMSTLGENLTRSKNPLLEPGPRRPNRRAFGI